MIPIFFRVGVYLIVTYDIYNMHIYNRIHTQFGYRGDTLLGTTTILIQRIHEPNTIHIIIRHYMFKYRSILAEIKGLNSPFKISGKIYHRL